MPDDNVALKKKRHLDPWHKVCLNCNLERCYADGDRDDTSIKRLNKYKKLCPVEIARRMKWTPERMLDELR
jgi:hypothetical protein